MREFFLALTMIEETTKDQRVASEEQFLAVFRSFRSLLDVLQLEYPEEDFEKPPAEQGYLPMIVLHNTELTSPEINAIVDLCNAQLRSDFEQLLPIRMVVTGRNTNPRIS